MSYADYLNSRKSSSIQIKDEDNKKEEMTEKEADSINKKRANLNIIGHICVIIFVGICIIFGLICLLKSFGGNSNIVTSTMKKAVGG